MTTKRRMAWPAVALCIGVLAFSGAAEVTPAAPGMQAALFLKLLEFHKTIATGAEVRIHVVSSKEFASEIQKGVGKKIGTAELKKVTQGDGLPAERPDVIYIGSADKAAELIKYAREKKVVTLTGIPALVESGVCLGVGVESGKLKVLYNPEASKEEGSEWGPGLMKIVGGAQ